MLPHCPTRSAKSTPLCHDEMPHPRPLGRFLLGCQPGSHGVAVRRAALLGGQAEWLRHRGRGGLAVVADRQVHPVGKQPGIKVQKTWMRSKACQLFLHRVRPTLHVHCCGCALPTHPGTLRNFGTGRARNSCCGSSGILLCSREFPIAHRRRQAEPVTRQENSIVISWGQLNASQERWQ